MKTVIVDHHCGALADTERCLPFGPETVVWKVNGHMFAAYTLDGQGLSIRTEQAVRVLARLREGRTATDSYLTGGGWILLPWSTRSQEIRIRLNESYRLVRREWPSRTVRSL